MPRLSRGSVVQFQSLNELLVFVKRAPKTAGHPPAFYLRALRGKLRMSQRQLARRSGVSQAQIARIEIGDSEPDLATVRRLFGALFCDLLILPKPRLPLGDALSERNAETRRPKNRHTSLWAT